MKKQIKLFYKFETLIIGTVILLIILTKIAANI
jgi:hypothetical protein